MGNQFPQSVMKSLPVQLTEVEIKRFTREQIDLHKAIDLLTTKRAEVNAEIRPKQKRIDELIAKLDTETEDRPVECEIRESPKGRNRIEIIRLDTGAQVEERTMTRSEMQGDWLAETEAAAKRLKKARKAKAEGSEGDDSGDADDDASDGGGDDNDSAGNGEPEGAAAAEPGLRGLPGGKKGGSKKGRKR